MPVRHPRRRSRRADRPRPAGESDNCAQIGVRTLVPVPRAGAEAKAFEGFVTGGTLKYAGLTGAVHYEPVTGRAGQYAVTFH
ncbi:hypothetical protein ADK51_00840 [Streptomyces sp. WM6368]|nr:hypothetical protein ADK51_00840 [Streptomyces sp. WM6368]